MIRVILALCAAGWVAAATTAEAGVKVGDKLYIKAKNTKLLTKPKSTARVLKILQPGQQVVWNGSVRKRKQWHKVTFQGKKGVVYRSTLSTKPPSMEMVASGQQVDAAAFASSGAATKALGAGAKTYGENSNFGDAVASLERLEDLAESIDTTQQAAHVRKNRLAPNVGAEQ